MRRPRLSSMIVILGWSDGGRGDLRAANTDRDEVSQLLRLARDEGRLDDAEHDRLAGAVRVAKTRHDLVLLTADLPAGQGVRDWVDAMRPRGADREDARHWLAGAAREGRLSDREYEQRLAALTAVATYADLRRIVDGLPGWSGTAEPDRLAGDDDRGAALAALADAVADRRVEPAEAPALDADIRHARRIRDLDALLAGLAAQVGDRKRRDALEALEAAHRDGRLDAAEHAARAHRVPEVTGDADLGELVADLRGDARRLTETERQEVAGTLRKALDEGRLDLAEFDERVRAAHAAATAADIAPLVADLIVPPRPARRGWTDALFDRFVANSAMLPGAEHRWLRWFWKWSAGATLLAYGLLLAFWDAKLTFVVGIWALIVALWAETGVARLFADPGWGLMNALNQVRAAVDGIAAANPAIKKITIEYPVEETREGNEKVVLKGVASVDVERVSPGEVLGPGVRDEIVRVLWQSRLYPLREVRLWTGESTTVKLTGVEAKRLKHRHGPRPYGPLPPALASLETPARDS